MIGNSLIPVLTDNSDAVNKGYIISASSTAAYTRYSPIYAIENLSTNYYRWSVGATPSWWQIKFPSSIKITDFSVTIATTGDCCLMGSNDGTNYSIIFQFSPSLHYILLSETIIPAVTKYVKFQGALNALSYLQIYGCNSTDKYVLETSNKYIYNDIISNKEGQYLIDIKQNNELYSFIDEYNNKLVEINESFKVLKIKQPQ